MERIGSENTHLYAFLYAWIPEASVEKIRFNMDGIDERERSGNNNISD